MEVEEKQKEHVDIGREGEMASNNTFRNLRNTMRSTNYNSYGFPSEYTNLNLVPGNGPLGRIYTRPNINGPVRPELYQKVVNQLNRLLFSIAGGGKLMKREHQIFTSIVKSNILILLEDKPETLNAMRETLSKFAKMPRFKTKERMTYFLDAYDSIIDFNMISLKFYLGQLEGGSRRKTKRRK